MRIVNLSVYENVELDGSGNGTVSVGPTASGETWLSPQVSVHCDTNVKEATAKVYVGAEASSRYFADGTTWGSTGDSTTNIPSPVVVGAQIFAVWTGGDAGTTAHLVVQGTRQVP